MKHSFVPRVIVLAVFALAGPCAVAADSMTKVYVNDGETYELDVAGTANTANNATVHGSYTYYGVNLVLGTGCTVKLTGAAGDGSDFTLNAAVYCPSGSFTIDGSELQGYSDTLRWCGCAYAPYGTATVKGFKRIVFGNTKVLVENTTASVAINVGDVLFDDATAEGLVFTNTAAICRALATCPYTVAPGTVFWPAYRDALSAEGDVFAPDGWTLGIVNTGSVANATIRVPDGYNLPFRPCGVQFAEGRMGNWGGMANGLRHNLVLDGESARLDIWNNAAGTVRFTGDISGSGSVSFRGQSANKITVAFMGRAAYTGKTTIRSNVSTATGNDTIVFFDPAPASSCLELGNALSATYKFHPYGYQTSNTVITVNAFSGVDNEVDVVEVATNQTIRVGAVSGSIAFRGPASGLVVVDSLAADAHVRLLDGVRLQVNAVGAGADVVLGAADDTASGSWHLYGPDNGTPVWLPISETVPGGRIVYGGRLVLSRSWTAKAALWLDATASDSITYLRDVNADTTSVPENGILWWRDRRPDQTTYAMAQARFATNSTANINSFPNLYPLYKSNGPNGLSYIDFERNQSRLYGMSVGAALSNPKKTGCKAVPSAYAIAVMKCADSTGLGTSVFAGKTWDYYSRGGAGASKPMFTNETVAVHKDGTAVASPTTTPFDTSWGIYSFTASEPVIGLACLDPSSSNFTGGFSFGEIILFGETPTDAERMLAEKYLSDKWGLDISHAGAVLPKTLDFDVAGPAETALLTLGDDCPYDLTVNVNLADGLADGIYPLVTYGDVRSYSLGTVTGDAGRYVSLVWRDADSTLCLNVASRGTTIIFR